MVYADPGARNFRATGAGRGIAPTRRGDGGRRLCRRNAPPILFLAPQKENGPCTVQEKKRFRGERACLIPGKSLPAAWIARGWEVWDTPCAAFRLRSKVASAGLEGQAFLQPPATTTRVCTRGKLIQRTRTARASRWVQNWWQSARTAPVLKPTCALRKFGAKRFFSWTAPPPVLFLTRQKENGGWIIPLVSWRPVSWPLSF